MNEKIPSQKLLKNRKVIEEINRHQWLESEKHGYDIGFDLAAEDWLKHFSKAWMNYHMPKRKAPPKRKASPSRRSSAHKARTKQKIKRTK